MRNTLFDLLPPLLSMILVVIGNGLLSTLTSLRLQLEDYSTLTIGLINASFYVGLMMGSIKIERTVTRIGNIRAYAAYAALLAIATVIQTLWVNGWIWFFCRLVSGYSMAALYIVTESWFLVYSSVEVRGRLLAIYMLSLYAAQSLGQFLLYLGSPLTFELFSVVTLFICFSILPIAMIHIKAPILEMPSSLSFRKLFSNFPASSMGAFIAGLWLSSVYGFLPVYVLEVGLGLEKTALVMGLTIFGGMLFQYPIGKAADIFNKRKLLWFLCITTFVLSLMMLFTSYYFPAMFLITSLFFGGVTFVLYPICINFVAEKSHVHDMVLISRGMNFFYGIGAILGPIFSAIFIYSFSPIGLFIFFMITTLIFGSVIYTQKLDR